MYLRLSDVNAYISKSQHILGMNQSRNSGHHCNRYYSPVHHQLCIDDDYEWAEEYGRYIRHLRYINYSRLLMEMNRRIMDKPLITPGQCSLYDHHIFGDHYLCAGTTDPILQRITTNRYFYTE